VILTKTQKGDERPAVSKESILTRSPSVYEAVVAIAKEARRLNAGGGVYLEGDEKALPKAVKNFVEGKVEYHIEGDPSAGAKGGGKGDRGK
jgi:DNA-directed RNA polymerase subunit K/omega